MGLWVKFNDVMCTTNSIYRNFDLFHCTRVFQSFNKNNKVYYYMKKLNSLRINTMIVCKTERKQYKYLYTYTINNYTRVIMPFLYNVPVYFIDHQFFFQRIVKLLKLFNC